MAAPGRRGSDLSRRLATVPPQPFSGVVYRFIGSRFLHAPLGSAGSKLHGGRFNPPGSFEVLYTALAADTALAEREGLLLTAAGIKAARSIRTSVLLRLDCRLAAVLDLGDEAIRRRLRISLADLIGPWLPWNVAASGSSESETAYAPSQRIGVAMHQSRRFEAILSPSAKDPAGTCLAIFPDRLRPESQVSVEDPGGMIAAALGLRRV